VTYRQIWPIDVKSKAVRLRGQGAGYAAIQNVIEKDCGMAIPFSTLHRWFSQNSLVRTSGLNLLRMEERLKMKALARSLHLSGVGYKRLRRYFKQRLQINVSLGTMSKWLGDLHPDFQPIRPFQPKLSRELSYVIGATLGDGTAFLRKEGGVVKLKVKDHDFACEYARNMSRILKRKIHVRMLADQNRSPFHLVRINSSSLARFFGRKIRELLPFIEYSPKYFLRGLFDAEGSVAVSAQKDFRVCLTLSNTNIKILKMAKRLLEQQFRIPVWASPQMSKKSSRRTYDLVIWRRQGVELFRDRIVMSIARKRQKLADALWMIDRFGQKNAILYWKIKYVKVGRIWVKRSLDATSPTSPSQTIAMQLDG